MWDGPKDLGERTNSDVLNELLEVRRKSVVDAGCGDMTFTKCIIDAGGEVLAIDLDVRHAELNRQQSNVPGLRFVEAGAENLPVAESSLDGGFFIYSLHHVLVELYGRVFDEGVRVLKPGRFLHVVEAMGCPLNAAIMQFHDKEAVRQAGQDALVQYALPRFDSLRSIEYHGIRQFENFVREFLGSASKPGHTEADVLSKSVEELLEKYGARGYRFEAPSLVHVLPELAQRTTE